MKPLDRMRNLAFVMLLTPLFIALIVNLATVPAALVLFDSATAPAWIQAIGSLLAIGIAIYIPWNDRRVEKEERASKRLLLSSARRAGTGMIQLEIHYEPEFRHSGIEARVRILAPETASLLSGLRRDVTDHAGQRKVETQVQSLAPQDRLVVPLTILESDPQDGLVRGALHIADRGANTHLERAQVEVELWSTASNEIVTRKAAWISPLF